MPTVDDQSKPATDFSGEHYQKAAEWAAFKKSRGARLDVAMCEVHILHLQEEVFRQEKLCLGVQKRNAEVQASLDAETRRTHDLDTALQLARKESENDKRLLHQAKQANRIIEVLIGLGCAGIGALPSLHPIVEKGASNGVAWALDAVLAVVCIAMVLVPSLIMKGE